MSPIYLFLIKIATRPSSIGFAYPCGATIAVHMLEKGGGWVLKSAKQNKNYLTFNIVTGLHMVPLSLS